MTDQVELVLDARALLGEGALWDHQAQRLYWVDIERGEVHVYDPAAGEDRCLTVGQMVGTVVARASGGLMLAVEQGFASFDPDTGALAVLAAPEAGKPGLRFNDGKCDPAGRFWAGSMGRDDMVPGVGTLYCLDGQHRAWPRVTGATCPNGIAWSQDLTTMYWVDSGGQTIDAFDYDHATGEVGNRRVACTLPADFGLPDGMTMDEAGNLWVAGWGHGKLSCWDPRTGACLRVLGVPASLVTSCAFGGPDLDALYITTARTSLDDATLAREPLAGGLFVVRPGVRGLPAPAYAG